MRPFPFFFALAALSCQLAGSVYAASADKQHDRHQNNSAPDAVYQAASFIESKESFLPKSYPEFPQFPARQLPLPERPKVVFSDGSQGNSANVKTESGEKLDISNDAGADDYSGNFVFGFDNAVVDDLPGNNIGSTAHIVPANSRSEMNFSEELNKPYVSHLVPEPGTFLLIGLAALGLPLGGIFRKKGGN